VHVHRWTEKLVLTPAVSEVECLDCHVKAIAKGKGYEFHLLVTEWICCHLVKLLAARGVKNIDLLDATFSFGSPVSRWHGGDQSTGPWGRPAVILERVGEHWRLSNQTVEGLIIPGWLYWFDRWIGRLDGHGDSNLLVVEGGLVVPVDWGMSFPWARDGGIARTPRIDDLEVPCHPFVREARDENARIAIKSFTDDELWNVVVSREIPHHLLPMGLLVAYFSGLRLRRDLL